MGIPTFSQESRRSYPLTNLPLFRVDEGSNEALVVLIVNLKLQSCTESVETTYSCCDMGVYSTLSKRGNSTIYWCIGPENTRLEKNVVIIWNITNQRTL